MRQEKEIKITKEIAEEIMADRIDLLEKIRKNVYCHNCENSYHSAMIIEEYWLNDLGDIILKGKCQTCGHPVARYIESGEDPKSLKIAKKYLKKRKNESAGNNTIFK